MTAARDGSLLVIVDMQRVYAEPDSPWVVPDFSLIVERVNRLIAAFADRVVFTRFMIPARPEGSWREYYGEFSFITDPATAPLLELAAPWGGTDRPVLDATTFSKYGPELRALAGAGNTLVLCGVSTECCVLSTALDAVDAGTPAHIVADACASVSREAHESALLVAKTGFSPMVKITTVEDEVRALATAPSSARPRP